MGCRRRAEVRCSGYTNRGLCPPGADPDCPPWSRLPAVCGLCFLCADPVQALAGGYVPEGPLQCFSELANCLVHLAGVSQGVSEPDRVWKQVSTGLMVRLNTPADYAAITGPHAWFTPLEAMSTTGTRGRPFVRPGSLRDPPAMAVSAARDFSVPAEQPPKLDGGCLHLCPSGGSNSHGLRGSPEILCRVLKRS